MTSSEIRQKFLNFFKERGHAILPSASLVTSDEPGLTNATLFNSAGMQPLVPYLMGSRHPAGNKLASVQKCLRTTDIDEVGDATHATFFEMLGNWSLGAYFKSEAIEMSYQFLTDQEKGLGLDPARLYITVFAGDANAPSDTEAAKIWQKYVPAERIYFLPAKNNWWSAGDNGPCGPDTEMFYDLTSKGLGDLTPEQFLQADERQDVVEIWNDVFMEYEKKAGLVVGKLTQRNVDTGAGLERMSMVLQGKNNIFETDLFAPIMSALKEMTGDNYKEKPARIIADHLKASVFLISDGILPSNTDRGYVLRKLLRRACYYLNSLGAGNNRMDRLSDYVVKMYQNDYPELVQKKNEIGLVITNEETAFFSNLVFGQKLLDKIIIAEKFISGTNAFLLSSTYGYPFELILDVAKARGVEVDVKDFNEKKKTHQAISQAGAEQKFKGGLASDEEQVIKYHTATHLLHQALTDVLGPAVAQKGSNITDERLRFDFAFERKLTEGEKEKIEAIVNEKIQADLSVKQITLPRAEAEASGARHLFAEKYGEQVSVYFVGDNLDKAYSKEFCGGPHVSQTGDLGRFKIIKEEAVASGVRRIKAVLE